MLFNSSGFVFGFLPLTLLGFYLIGTKSRSFALSWIILASLFFYAWWRPLNVAIIVPMLLGNFVLARVLRDLSPDPARRRRAAAILILGIAFNVVFLGYFKYTNFILGAVNDVFGENLVLTQIILPLGISFITFQKIAFLIDVHAGRVRDFTLHDYCLFVLFFPQLIAGPIVHYREMMPQFHAATCRFDKRQAAVGLTLFVFGLFKKAVIADNLASFVSPIYDHAAAGGSSSLLLSWMAAVGFTLQIYFDFSGYSDMAIGLGWFFGVRLPPNFNSPLKSGSIIDFWSRWHMTLTRFLTAYIYNPLALALTRRRAAKNLSGHSGAHTSLGAFLQILAFPTLLTMTISGLWHGAGYLFVLWGIVHGMYLVVNHAWRLVVMRTVTNKHQYDRLMKPFGTALTLLCVVVAMVLFRSPTLATARTVLGGMIGINGITLPSAVYDHLGPLTAWLGSLGVVPETGGGREFLFLATWIGATSFVALFLPNTLQLVARYEPALGVKSDLPQWRIVRKGLLWEPSLAWAAAVSIVSAVALTSLGQPTEFLYWQF